jgi:hypothetical protein
MGPEGCLEFNGHRDTYGYGIVASGSRGTPSYRRVKAHRLAWEREHGEIPSGMCVLHSCDNPPCVNPKHLFLGTQRDNAKDRYRKGRSAKGENHGRSKLDAEAVREIRELRGKMSQERIGRRFGVAQTVISRVQRREIWRHV